MGPTEIREYGASAIQVMRRMRAMLEELHEEVRPELRPAVEEELGRLDATVERRLQSAAESTATTERTATTGARTSGRAGLAARKQNGPEDPPLAARFGRVGEAGLEQGHELVAQLPELGVVEPHSGEVVADSIAQEIYLAPGQIAVKVTEEPRDKGHERLAVLVGAHLGELVESDAGGGQPEHVRALQGAPDPAFGDHGEHPRADQARDVAVEAGGGHIGELGSQLGCRERPVAEEGLHDPQPDRVQEQVGARHGDRRGISISKLLIFPNMRNWFASKHTTSRGNHRRIAMIAVGAVAFETLVMKLRGYRVGTSVVVRCQRDHLFTTIWIPGASLKSLRLGWWRFQHCPVGHHWSLVTPVRESELTEENKRAAAEHRDIGIP